MKTPYTALVCIEDGALGKLKDHLKDRYQGGALVICDKNTERFAAEIPALQRIVLPGDAFADSAISDAVEPKSGVKVLVSVGSGSVTDITRCAAHRLGLPFIACPTAPSMDGYISGIAAMTIRGQKLSLPSTPPVAVFGDPAVYGTAPRSLVNAGVGDILGKYISLADWRIAALLQHQTVDPEIEGLVVTVLQEMLALDPATPAFHTAVLKALVTSGMAIQYYGSSRPCSGAEHHFSHLWEMHVINPPTEAHHGDKVGVSTLMLLERYRTLADSRIVLKGREVSESLLRPVFGPLTDGIIQENTPAESDGITQNDLDRNLDAIHAILRELPDPASLTAYYDKLGMLKTLRDIDLPDSEEFVAKTFTFAPYTRKRLTLLRLI